MGKKENDKKYRESQKGKENRKKYINQNRDKIKKQHLKPSRIHKWKSRGVIFHDWDLLYEIYLQTTHCDECKCLLTYDRYMRNTTKCLDHDHTITDDNNVRNILCHCCNNKRR
jgi:hypothetical protein